MKIENVKTTTPYIYKEMQSYFSFTQYVLMTSYESESGSRRQNQATKREIKIKH